MSTTELSPFFRLPLELRAKRVGYYLSHQPPIEQHYTDYGRFLIYSEQGPFYFVRSRHCKKYAWKRAQEAQMQADKTRNIEEKLLLLQALPGILSLSQHEHALFFTCQTLRRDYLQELTNPVHWHGHILHVFHILPNFARERNIVDVFQKECEPFSRARKIKIQLELPRGSRSDKFKHVMEFLRTFTHLEHAAVDILNEMEIGSTGVLDEDGWVVSRLNSGQPLHASEYYKNPILELTDLLQTMGSMAALKITAGAECILRSRRWDGLWASRERAEMLDRMEAQERTVVKASEDKLFYTRELPEMVHEIVIEEAEKCDEDIGN